MSLSTRPLYGNITTARIIKNIDYAGTTSSAASFNVTFTVPGVQATGRQLVIPLDRQSTPVTGVALVAAYVSANNTITGQFINSTGGSVSTTAATAAAPYYFLLMSIDGNVPGDIPAAV